MKRGLLLFCIHESEEELLKCRHDESMPNIPPKGILDNSQQHSDMVHVRQAYIKVYTMQDKGWHGHRLEYISLRLAHIPYMSECCYSLIQSLPLMISGGSRGGAQQVCTPSKFWSTMFLYPILHHNA